MVPVKEPGPVWIDAVMTLKDETGNERLIASYSRMKELGTRVGRGMLVFNDDKHCFDVTKEIPLDALLGLGRASASMRRSMASNTSISRRLIPRSA